MGLWRRKRSGSSGASSNTSSGTTSTEASHGNGIMALSELSLSKQNTKSSPATSPTSRFMRSLFRSSSSTTNSRGNNNNNSNNINNNNNNINNNTNTNTKSTKNTSGITSATAAPPRGTFTRRQPKQTPAEAQQEMRINRPLNAQNMEHQRILAAFTFSFGRSSRRRSDSLGAWSARSGISPSATRHASIDSGYSPHVGGHHHHHHHHHLYHHGGDVLEVMTPTQEIPGEESDKDSADIPAGVLPRLTGRC